MAPPHRPMLVLPSIKQDSTMEAVYIGLSLPLLEVIVLRNRMAHHCLRATVTGQQANAELPAGNVQLPGTPLI